MGIFNTAMIKRGGPKFVAALNDQSYLIHPWQSVLYVQSVHTRAVDGNNTGKSADAPLKTIVKAVALAAAGDVIVVGPGHIELVTTAAGLDISKNYLTIIGVGNKMNRPAIRVGGIVGAYWQISGAGVRMSNFLMDANLDAVTKMLNISGASVILEDFRLADSATVQTLTGILATATASRGTIRRMEASQRTAGAVACVEIAALTEFDILDSDIVGDYSQAAIYISAAALQLGIWRNEIDQLNTTSLKCIESAAAAASGNIGFNSVRNHTDASVAHITMGAGKLFSLYENYFVNNDGETGKIFGTASV